MDRFRDKSEARLWYEIFMSLRKAGAGVEYASTQADLSLTEWRGRNPDGYDPAPQDTGGLL